MMADIINVKDYPRSLFSHYWEIQIYDDYKWIVSFFPYDPWIREADGGEVFSIRGSSDGPGDARFESQSAALEKMEDFKRL